MIPTPTTTTIARTERDDGSILILALVFSTALALIVVGLATYASATLRLGQVAERSSDRLASANGAMDSALEDIERGVGPCKLFGQDYTVTESVNGLKSNVDCNWVGGRFNVGDLFAIVMTGAGEGRTGPLLTVTNGGNSANAEKIFEGPVYMASTPTAAVANPTTDFKANLTIKNADLMYTASNCTTATPSLPSELTIAPVGYGTQCYQDLWNDPAMFGAFAPAEPGINGSSFPGPQPSTPPTQDALGCYIWPPGRYTSPPQTLNGSYNYFRSGDYLLDGMGSWSVKNAFLLFGYPGDTGPGIPGIQNNDSFATNPCRNAWKNDSNKSGATVYFGGNSQLAVDGLGAVEISGRERSGQNIAVQALESGSRKTTIRGDQRLIRTESGSNKQLSIQGLVWAPYSALEFDLISNDAVAALTGGAVVSEISAGASANTNNFLIRVDTKPQTKVLQLTTTAASDGNQGSTSVKAVVTVQVDKGATSYALQSRRLLGLTPE